MSAVLFREKGWRFLIDLLATEKAVILCDQNTKQCLEYLSVACPPTKLLPIIQIPDGEQHKTLKTCELIWYQLTELDADRNSVLINLGGGVVTDVGGFVASTFMRGIRFVHVPTSLLAMVDAAIGGKTGVDFGGLKNMVGTFANPEAVIVDTNFLKTLPSRQYRSGLAEVLKHAFISDYTLLNQIEVNETELISKSIHVKLEVVKTDEREAGERKKLNFGHTIGHALESHFLDKEETVYHGEAVAAGMIMAAYMSHKVLGLTVPELNAVCTAIDAIFSRIPISLTDWEVIKKRLIHDKKNKNGCVQFVLLKNIGETKIDQTVSERVLNQAYQFYIYNA